MVANDGGSSSGGQTQQRKQATVPVAEAGSVTGVREADAWVDPILRAQPSKGTMLKVVTLELRLKPLFQYFHLSPYCWFPDSTPFWVLTV